MAYGLTCVFEFDGVYPTRCPPPDTIIRCEQGVGTVSLKDSIQKFFTDARDIAQVIAPICAVLGFLGLGLMYLGSSWPLIFDWKRENPKAANQVVMGLLFIIAASSITTLISFS